MSKNPLSCSTGREKLESHFQHSRNLRITQEGLCYAIGAIGCLGFLIYSFSPRLDESGTAVMRLISFLFGAIPAAMAYCAWKAGL